MKRAIRISGTAFIGLLWFAAFGAAIWVGAAAADGSSTVDGAPVSFRNDVLPIFAKAGCNSGGCHGALAGKGGFRLSLFGYNPDADHFAITREDQGRRIDLDNPGLSLLLLKPTVTVRHKGGKRIEVGSADYQTLARWIAEGAPGPHPSDPQVTSLRLASPDHPVNVGDSVALMVEATYSDGSHRNVTPWARFTSTDETVATVDGQGRVTIIGCGQGAVTAWYASRIEIARLTSPYSNSVSVEVFRDAPRANFIDSLVLDQLERLRLQPSPPAQDAVFVRRAYLDTIGCLPKPEEVEAFVEDTRPDKYARLADQLFARPEFVDFWAYKWSDVLLVSGASLRPDAVRSYYGWIRDRVADNTPWDQMVRQVVTSKGSSVDDGPSNFYAVHQDPESMAENVSQAFLSLSINCAHCHNHPLEKWTNDQYYQFANLFARVRAKGWGGDNRSGDGHRTVFVDTRGDLIQPRTGRPQAPAPLDAPAIPPDDPGDRREKLADWLTSPTNPYFVRAIANRIWANFLGVGIVESVDDLRTSNPASNEPLLAALAGELVSHHFDMRSLMRDILVSQTYRRSSEVLPGNREDRRHYSRFYPRRLSAEVLSDAITEVTGVPDTFSELAMEDGSTEATRAYPVGSRALQLADASVKSYFLKTFGRNQRQITCECERSSQPSLVQVLHLSNGSTINGKLESGAGRMAAVWSQGSEPARWLEEMWMRCLSRRLTDRERQAMLASFADAPPDQRRLIAEDVIWAVLTSREFLFQH